MNTSTNINLSLMIYWELLTKDSIRYLNIYWEIKLKYNSVQTNALDEDDNLCKDKNSMEQDVD